MNQLPADPDAVYTKDYYDHYGSDSGAPYERNEPVWQRHFQTLAQTLVQRYHPRTVLDVGCAKGFLVEQLRDRGVEAFGVDVSSYAISQVREDIRPYCRVARGNQPITGHFDLITCIEVAEHVPEADARAMIAEMCRHSDHVIFSSTPSGFDEPTHINIHPAEYWIELFQQQGFFPDRNFQPDFITPQALRFVRCQKPSLNVGVFSHEPPNCAVALLRLAGIIRHLERQNRMQLQWCAARDPHVDIEKILESDLFTIHREFCDRRLGAPVIAAIRELDKPIIFELDDLLINVPASNPNHKYCTSITPDVLEMLREADFITVTTDPLRRYLEEAEPRARGKTHVLPNYINLEIWDGAKPPPEKPEEPFVVGWFGTATHDEDLAIIKPAIVQLARKYAGRLAFKFWGYLPEDLKGIPGVQLMRGSQPDLRLHARDVVNSRIDLALAPLLDHPFNHAKSDLKWLEYSICYIPAIYSTISPYTNSVAHGRTGWLVDNKAELWAEAIELFMRDHHLRRTIAIQAHDEVRRTRCVEAGAEKWDALYRSFCVSGPSPTQKKVQSPVTPKECAAAYLMQHVANAFCHRGENAEALKIYGQAIVKCLPPVSAQGSLVHAVLMQYHNVFKKLKETAELNAILQAAKTVAQAGHAQAAVQLYFQALNTATTGQNPVTVLHTAVEVAKALKTLDPGQGSRVLEMGIKLAKSARSQTLLQVLEQLRAEYSRAVRSPGQPKKTKPGDVLKAPGHVPATGSKVPMVSVVIPVFNNLDLTQTCLASLAGAPSNVDFEIIVVDNASTDGTPQYLRQEAEAGRIRVVTNAQNEGFARACNQGAQVARGSKLVFLNNDTRVTDGWISALARVFQQANVGVAGAKLLYADGTIQHAGIEFINGVPDHPHRRARADLPEANKMRDLDMVTGACLMTPRDLFLKLGGFDELFRNGVEDVDYCLRVRALGRRVVYQPQSVVYHHEGRTVGRFDHVNENLKIFFARWKGAFDGNGRFIVPPDRNTVRASRSVLLNCGPADAPEKAQSPIVVGWEGSFLDFGSLSHVNREMVESLKEFPNLQIHLVSSRWLPATAENLKGLGVMTPQPPANSAVTVRHAWPPDWRRPSTGKLAVIQPWEFGSLPDEWVKNAVNVDEFWVPSSYVRDVYIASGVPAAKVVVVPNGVNQEKFHPKAAPMKLATQKKFKFLFVGGTIGRKGPDLLLRAYLKRFTAADDVCLVIKDFGGNSVYSGQTFERQIQSARAIPGAPEILYLNEEMPPDSLPGLYTACDCLVLPYRGEGFGLPVLEAMACGLPVIVTAGGSTDDFVLDEFAWRIPAEKRIFGHEVSGMKLSGEGWLLEPNLDVLGQLMVEAFSHPDQCRERGELASRYALENHSWKKAAAIAAGRLHVLAAGVAAPAKVPPVALIGQLHDARNHLRQKNFEAAWKAVIAAIAKRPFHPEGCLLLAEIAIAAGDVVVARECIQSAADLAPAWNAPRKLLKKLPKKPATGRKPGWLILPDTVKNWKSRPRTLSVCLIVKNEEQFLGQCLKSVRDVAHQIIVVDTGSTDRTVEVAKEFGAEIYTHQWNDDFSAARNAALEHATSDWIFMLDGDEEFPGDQHSKLLADMKNPGVLAFRLPLVNCGHEAEGQSFVPRLFRNVPGAHFAGRIHEQVFPSLLPLCQLWGLGTATNTTAILHHGYNSQVTRDRNKVERNLKLLRRACEENPDDVNLTMNLGLELVRSGNLAEGVEKYRKAFQLMCQLPASQVAPELREALLTQFTSQLYKIRGHEEVIKTLTCPQTLAGGLTASLNFALGLSHFELGHYREAAEQMRLCLANRHRPAFSPINTDILTSMPNHCLALALSKLNDQKGAEKAFEAALGENGRVEDVKLDYARFLAVTNRPVEALHKMHDLVAANCRNSALWRAGAEIALSRPEFLEFARDWTGESMRYVGDDPVVATQRAEALLFCGEVAEARALWERVWNNGRQYHALAALVLCEAIESQTTHVPEESEELSVSREFISWYQRLISMRAKSVIERLNEQMDRLSRILPTATRKIEKALVQAQGRETLV